MGKLKSFFLGLAVGAFCCSAVFAVKMVSDRLLAGKSLSLYKQELDADKARWTRRVEYRTAHDDPNNFSDAYAMLYLEKLIELAEKEKNDLKLNASFRGGGYIYRNERDRLFKNYRMYSNKYAYELDDLFEERQNNRKFSKDDF